MQKMTVSPVKSTQLSNGNVLHAWLKATRNDNICDLRRSVAFDVFCFPRFKLSCDRPDKCVELERQHPLNF